MSSRKINNSRKREKVKLRLDILSKIKKDKVYVLDAFSGKSIMWNMIILQSKKGIKTLALDKNEPTADICGDNLKIIPTLDLSGFDIIDLDAWGCPAEQLLKVFANKTLKKGTVIVYTYIITSFGGGNKKLLNEIGLTDLMQKKAPILCAGKQRVAFDHILYKNGIREVTEFEFRDNTTKKRYGYFTIPE